MKFATEYLWFCTEHQREYINITDEVQEIVRKSGIKEGMVLVSAMHITAGIYVNDAESGLIADIDKWLEELAPFDINYNHHQTGETNGDSHLKSFNEFFCRFIQGFIHNITCPDTQACRDSCVIIKNFFSILVYFLTSVRLMYKCNSR